MCLCATSCHAWSWAAFLAHKIRKYQCNWTACSSATSSSGPKLLNRQCKWTRNSSISSANGPLASLHQLKWICWSLRSRLGLGPISCHKTSQLCLPVDQELLRYIHKQTRDPSRIKWSGSVGHCSHVSDWPEFLSQDLSTNCASGPATSVLPLQVDLHHLRKSCSCNSSANFSARACRFLGYRHPAGDVWLACSYDGRQRMHTKCWCLSLLEKSPWNTGGNVEKARLKRFHGDTLWG